MTSNTKPSASKLSSNFFALRLARIATLSAVGAVGEHYHSELLFRQIDWLACLINPADENVTYDLRIISEPDINDPMRGRLTVAVLCKVDSASKSETSEFALEFKRLCEARFDDEYEFELIQDPQHLNPLLVPFTVRSIAEIKRRAGALPLDTLQSNAGKPLGFLSKTAAKVTDEQARTDVSKPVDERSVFHVYSYIINPAPLTYLHKLLLLHGKPMMISYRLRPTTLSDDEEKFLELQIARCERYGQVSLSHRGESFDALWPTLQQQARLLQSQFVKRLFSLKDNAALLRVEVASPEERISDVVLDSLGSTFSLPAGGTGAANGIESYLSGGYEYQRCPKSALREHAESLANLSLNVESKDAGPYRIRYLFDAFEAVAAFRFPPPTLEEPPGLQAKTARTQPAPANIPQTGQCIGNSYHNGRSQPVFLEAADRRRHVYVVGQTGTGKTTMFESLILEDLRQGEGLCVIDPHGDLIEKVLLKVPQRRIKDLILLDPADVERPVGFNVLEYETEAQKYFMVQEVIAIIETLMEKYDPNFTGPVFFLHVRMILLLLMSNPNNIGTLAQFYQVFNSEYFYKRFLPLPASVTDPMLINFVQEVLPLTNYTRVWGDGSSTGSWISSKFAGFVTDPMLRNMFGQQHSSINLREIMDSGKVLLVNLSKGRLGEVNSRLFGMFLIAKLQAAAMSRASVPIERRRDFYLYVDEFQNLATLNFGTLLSEARKYRLNLILTNQYVTQVDERISSAISGNVGTIVSFRVGAIDAEFLEREFSPVFNRYDLMQLDNFTSCVSTLIGGQVCRPFTMKNRLDTLQPDPSRGKEIRSYSRHHYGRPRKIVEKEILESLKQPQLV